MTRLTTALLLTAGLGTRLHPLTRLRAKPAIPVAGVPMAVRIIGWLRAAGITDLVMNLHAHPASLAAIVGDGSHLGVRVRYSWEQPRVLGSAGGPKQALDILGADTFLIANGDTLTDLEIGPLAAAHVASGALVTMAVIPNTRPDRYSGLRIAVDGAVLGVEPRGSSTPSYHFIGAQVAHRDAFAGAPAGRPSNSVGEVYPALIAAAPGSVRAHVCRARFWDIGTVSDYWTTSSEFAAAESFTPVSAVSAGAGAEFVNSIAWNGVVLEARSRVHGCIVTDDVRVEAGASYTNMILMRGADGSTLATPFAVELS
ncbi:MAG TPA: sugar phosphate nucleotidyltransferase [Vicinamibacterales bacterium]|nr:sugar phosphate nucleotidyltransferase [Vicinamibacterales bacterium]